MLRCEALQLLPSFLNLPEDPKRPIMDAVGAIIDSFPLTSRERSGSTQHTAYISQLVAVFDALCGSSDNAHNVTALLDVSPCPAPAGCNDINCCGASIIMSYMPVVVFAVFTFRAACSIGSISRYWLSAPGSY